MNPPARETTGPLTLRHLVDEPSLGLTVVEPADLTAVVRAAHSIEIDGAARWLRPGSVMLTTGLRFVDRPGDTAAQARLIDELVEAGVSALLLGVGVHFDEVPSGLRQAAAARGFPLLAVSAATPFSTVEDYVNRGSLSAETYLLKRTVWLQNDLLQALSADEPVNTLVVRLGTLCRGTAVLYESTGRVVASTGHGPLRLIWEEVSAREAVPQHFSIGQWTVSTRPFLLRGSGFRIAVASRTGSLIQDLGADLLETAERVLAAANAVRTLAMSQQRAEAERLVSALRDGVPSSRIRQTWDRLRQFRFRVGNDMRFLIASDAKPEPAPGNRRRVADLFHDAQQEGVPVVLAEDPEPDLTTPALAAVVSAGQDADDWLEKLGRSYVVGASGPFKDLTLTAQYFQEAITAWQLATRRRERGSPQTIVRLDEVDFATWLLTRRDDTQVAARFDRHFAELANAPDLVETVVTYLATDQDVKKTAEKLFVHPNTIRYRLRNVERLVGGPIASAKVVANLYLAFQDEIIAHTSTS
jgi:hypothetical protein